ncbi:hypothetical protein K504DRAFT_532743 [Pleomassaria siparia CBS 279.74]|uniref:Uncharacterized protein n=1 Tax=Pleomassaria siparia CBS 279.74 TaxID=1314801 RepID=A0A6G1KE27_9PLEO|nr:hypothetical protein K504DRAFT_532743 [Pleomassaria siparia CBS 279.74]
MSPATSSTMTSKSVPTDIIQTDADSEYERNVSTLIGLVREKDDQLSKLLELNKVLGIKLGRTLGRVIELEEEIEGLRNPEGSVAAEVSPTRLETLHVEPVHQEGEVANTRSASVTDQPVASSNDSALDMNEEDTKSLHQNQSPNDMATRWAEYSSDEAEFPKMVTTRGTTQALPVYQPVGTKAPTPVQSHTCMNTALAGYLPDVVEFPDRDTTHGIAQNPQLLPPPKILATVEQPAKRKVKPEINMGNDITVLLGDKDMGKTPEYVLRRYSKVAAEMFIEQPGVDVVKFTAYSMDAVALAEILRWMNDVTSTRNKPSIRQREDLQKFDDTTDLENLEVCRAARMLGLHDKYTANLAFHFCDRIRKGLISRALIAMISDFRHEINETIFDCLVHDLAERCLSGEIKKGSAYDALIREQCYLYACIFKKQSQMAKGQEDAKASAQKAKLAEEKKKAEIARAYVKLVEERKKVKNAKWRTTASVNPKLADKTDEIATANPQVPQPKESSRKPRSRAKASRVKPDDGWSSYGRLT